MIRSNETNLPNVSRVLYLGYICVFGSEDGVSSEIEVQSTSYRDTARSAGHDEITFNDTLTTQINSFPRLCFF